MPDTYLPNDMLINPLSLLARYSALFCCLVFLFCYLRWHTGYIIFVDGKEQLGANRFLVSDGLFIAKSLNRTMVEFPAANAGIGGAYSELAFGAYWDFDSLCR